MNKRLTSSEKTSSPVASSSWTKMPDPETSLTHQSTLVPFTLVKVALNRKKGSTRLSGLASHGETSTTTYMGSSRGSLQVVKT